MTVRLTQLKLRLRRGFNKHPGRADAIDGDYPIGWSAAVVLTSLYQLIGSTGVPHEPAVKNITAN